MLPKITGTVQGGEQVIDRLQTLGGFIREECKQSAHNSAEAVKTRAQEKVSGPVLKAPTGALKGSVNVKDRFTQTEIISTVGINLGSIPYARIHEYGGVIEHPGGTAFFLTPNGIRFVSNANALSQSLPRTGPHTIVMPERSYLRSSLHELASDIGNEVRAGLKRALHRAGFPA